MAANPKTPRRGQQRVFDLLPHTAKLLNIKLPTGYGKTYVAAGSYARLKAAGRVDHLLMVFPTTKQLEQFLQDGPGDLAEAGVSGPLGVIDVRFFGTQAVTKRRKGENQVFAITIQALTQARGLTTVQELMSSGSWMVVVDEHHHYGLENSWSSVFAELPIAFLLAMSATPHRPESDGAFGQPAVEVTYRDAVKEGAVKPLKGHSYLYRIDAVDRNGDIISFTTDELVAAVGSNQPEAVEKAYIQWGMRWSPKYISPLVTIPIERMLREGLVARHRLQALFGAMCVSHAELVCEQIRAFYPELSVDWVGTGTNGRSDKDNADILARFCPPKDPATGKRSPTLDALVHVGMGGEGLDSVNVSEVVHLNAANINNSNNQENGRGSRLLTYKADGVTYSVFGHINFDSSSEYARKKYVGLAIMDSMDCKPPLADEDDPTVKDREPRDLTELPDEPTIEIWHVELQSVESGDPEVQLYKRWLVQEGICGFTHGDITDPASSIHDLALAGYKNMRRREAEQHNEKSVVMQWGESVATALTLVTARVIRLTTPSGVFCERSRAGDIKKKINSRKKKVLGELVKDVELYRRHWQWLKNLESDLIAKGVPEWLA